MDLDENKQLVSRFLDLMGGPDLDAAFDLLTPDATWFTLTSRNHTSREAMHASIAYVYETVLQEPIQMDVKILTAEGDRVAVVSEGHAVTVDGMAYDNLYHFLFELRGSLICRIWEFNDTALIRDVLLRGPGGSLGVSNDT